MPAAVACFQGWYNANVKPSKPVRTDGTLDETSLCALIEVTQVHSADFPTPYPGSAPCGRLSTLAKVGIGIGAAVAAGGVVTAVVVASKRVQASRGRATGD